MRARDHASRMLSWWSAVGIDSADIGVRYHGGAMITHGDLELTALPLDWARAANVRGADVYVRPARGRHCSVVLLDDVRQSLALSIAKKYAALVVHTSPPGGCHVWLRCSMPLAEHERHELQRWLAHRCGADPGATSGAQFGRAAGFKNWKRDGCWVNTIAANFDGPSWDPPITTPKTPPSKRTPSSVERDRSQSAREWGWVCGLLEAGVAREVAYQRLLEAAKARQRPQAERYAALTIANAARRGGQ